MNAQLSGNDHRSAAESAHADNIASGTTSMQQAATSLMSLTSVGDQSTVTLLREIAELLDRATAVRQEITRRLTDDEKLYKNVLRILLAPTPQQAEPLIDLLGELTEQARTDKYSPERRHRGDNTNTETAVASTAETDAPPIHEAAATAFVLILDQPSSYAIDDQVFRQWAAQVDAGKSEFDLPTRNSEHPSRDLDRLVTDAIERGALIGDPRLELTIHEGDDDQDGPGYYVALHNHHGNQRLAGITSGWTKLYASDDATPAEQAREYLSQVCDVANRVLAFASHTPHPEVTSRPPIQQARTS